MVDTVLTRAQAREDSENIGRNPTDNSVLGNVIAARYHRHDKLKGALGVAAIVAIVSPLAIAAAQQSKTGGFSFQFKEVSAGVDERHHVTAGYDADILIRWGDPVLPGAPAFDPSKQSAAAQKTQFGYNNDFIGYLPMPGAANPSDHGLLVVNHEYTNEEMMFPGLGRQDATDVAFAKMTKELVDIEKAAHGGAVIEIRRENGKWRVMADSKFARRIDAETPIDITGPAAGHPCMKTKADPSGRSVRGMVNDCASGVTPWGTWLTCEENFNGYFWGKLSDGHPEAKSFTSYGLPANWYAWGKFEERFYVTKELNEANRFGWVVEVDPFDPTSTPKKRTALGRFKHEGAAVGATFSSATTKDGWFGMPDNCAIDGDGRLWIATDGNPDKATGRTDGLRAIETEGDAAPPQSCSSAAPPVPNCADRCSPSTARPCS